MNAFEIALSAGTVSAALFSIIYVSHLLRVSGRDRTGSPELVRQFVETAPMHRLDNLLSR